MASGQSTVWLGAAGVALVLVLAPLRAHAGASARLVYARSEQALVCPDQPALERAVAQRLGYSPFFPWAEQTIVAEISGNGHQLVARAQLVDKKGVSRGRRQLKGDAARCDELIAAIALAISITLDPLSVERPSSRATPAGAVETSTEGTDSPSPSPEPEVTGPPPPVPPAEPILVGGREARATNVDAPTATSALLEVGFFTVVGALPQPVPGLRTGIRLERGSFRLGIEAAGLLPAAESAASGGQIRASLIWASIYPCLRWGNVAGCALASLGRLHGMGEGVLHPREDSRAYAALGLRAMGALPLSSRLSLQAHADLQKTLTMLSLQLDGAEVWRPSQLSAAIGLDLTMLFFDGT